MEGTLNFDGEKPQPGARVIIVVEFPEKPIGVWNGTLISVNDGSGVPSTKPDAFPGSKMIRCVAHITDHPEFDLERGFFHGHEPYGYYDVYLASSATHALRHKLTEMKKELKGLKNRLDIERGVWHAALKAITNDGAVERFRKILEDFLGRLTTAHHERHSI